MKGNNSSSNRESRLDKREKRRKTNLILNGLIGLVILLIIIVSGSIFFSGNDDEVSTADKKQESKQTDEQKNDNESTSGQVSEENDTESDNEQQTEEETEELESAEDEEVITEGGSAPDVKNTIENPNWKPVGTSQTGEHTAVYDQNAVDWNEMVQAISYATGIDQGNMTIWFLGNNGPNSSVGTVSAKDGQQKYRAYIDWVDGEGWKPVKVEELK